MRCGYEWEAPRIPTPGYPVGIRREGFVVVLNEARARQKCVLPVGHPGHHRSSTKVMFDNVAFDDRPRS